MMRIQVSTLGLVLFVLAYCNAQSIPTIDLQISQKVVMPGTVATLTCKLNGFQHDTVVNMKKEVPVGQPIITHYDDISQSTVLKPLYRELGRFKVEKHIMGEELVVTLTINGVALEDSGWYSCDAFHEVHGDRSDRADLEVYRAPNAMLNRNGTITIKEGEVLDLTCTSTNAMPLPEMEMWITDSDKPEIDHHHDKVELNPLPEIPDKDKFYRIIDLIDRWRNLTEDSWRHVTKDFLISTETKKHCSELPGEPRTCPLYFDYEVTATRSEFKPDWRHDEKDITCLVRMPLMLRDRANASLHLDVLYPPKIICPLALNGTSYARPNKTAHQIACRVLSNPPLPDLGAWSWTDSPCGQQGPMLPAKGEEYNTTENFVSGDYKARTLTLKWNKPVTSQHYSKRYCLTVTRSADEKPVQKEFLLKEQRDRPLSASAHTASWIVFIASAILCFFFVHE